jgi:hypothetical protein
VIMWLIHIRVVLMTDPVKVEIAALWPPCGGLFFPCMPGILPQQGSRPNRFFKPGYRVFVGGPWRTAAPISADNGDT